MSRATLDMFAMLVGYIPEIDDTDADLLLVLRTRRPDWFR